MLWRAYGDEAKKKCKTFMWDKRFGKVRITAMTMTDRTPVDITKRRTRCKRCVKVWTKTIQIIEEECGISKIIFSHSSTDDLEILDENDTKSHDEWDEGGVRSMTLNRSTRAESPDEQIANLDDSFLTEKVWLTVNLCYKVNKEEFYGKVLKQFRNRFHRIRREIYSNWWPGRYGTLALKVLKVATSTTSKEIRVVNFQGLRFQWLG